MYLNTKPAFTKKIAAFTSWDVFPYILNEQRSGFFINSGYDTLNGSSLTREETLLNKTTDEYVFERSDTRYDQLTFLVAKDYIRKNQPRIVYLGLGETDEFAHQGRYDLYLNKANEIDKMLAELWHLVQTTPGYADNTSFIITTDHGRGKDNKWTAHSELIKGSSQTWLAIMGPGLPSMGEVKKQQQLYQRQLAQTIAFLLGEEFVPYTNSFPSQ
jgi:membrane-anchored protein YejM (alkaline phosphatase superfamily)